MKRILAVAPSSLVVLAGCVADGETETIDPADPLAPYMNQNVDWAECGAGALCAIVVAPLDWDNPGEGDDVQLALSRYEATGESQGSLFVNPGGPGASGYEFVLDSVDFAVSPALRESFDIIGWDPRGVNFSSAVSCAETDAFVSVRNARPTPVTYLNSLTHFPRCGTWIFCVTSSEMSSSPIWATPTGH